MSCYYGGAHVWQDITINGQRMQQCINCQVIIPG